MNTVPTGAGHPQVCEYPVPVSRACVLSEVEIYKVPREAPVTAPQEPVPHTNVCLTLSPLSRFNLACRSFWRPAHESPRR